jgi:hypothetical protein
LWLLPKRKRATYLEIWQGDLAYLAGFQAFLYSLETLRTALTVRWSSLAYGFQFAFAIGFLLLGLVLLSLADRNLSDFVLAFYFAAFSLFIDIRKPKLRRALEASSGFYFVVWALSWAGITFIKKIAENGTRDGSSEILPISLAALLFVAFLLLAIYWFRVPSEFSSFVWFRYGAVAIFLLALAGQIASRNFVELSFLIPNDLIGRVHALLHLVHDFSTAVLYLGVIGFSVFQLATRGVGSRSATARKATQ